jgi:hypothetical protein
MPTQHRYSSVYDKSPIVNINILGLSGTQIRPSIDSDGRPGIALSRVLALYPSPLFSLLLSVILIMGSQNPPDTPVLPESSPSVTSETPLLRTTPPLFGNTRPLPRHTTPILVKTTPLFGAMADRPRLDARAAELKEKLLRSRINRAPYNPAPAVGGGSGSANVQPPLLQTSDEGEDIADPIKSISAQSPPGPAVTNGGK